METAVCIVVLREQQLQAHCLNVFGKSADTPGLDTCGGGGHLVFGTVLDPNSSVNTGSANELL